MACGAFAFALLTFAVEAAAETAKPEWRDPEYGHRLRQVRQRQHKRPNQPLVLVLGSSCAQMGVSPAAMGFSDEPGQPFVYNFGYRGAFPLGVYLQVARLFDDGVKPAAIVVMICALECHVDGAAERQFPTWAPRLSEADLRRLAPYTSDPSVFRRELAAARRDPWAARRETLTMNLLPDWHHEREVNNHDGWMRMDRYGFTPFPEERLTDELRRQIWEGVRKTRGAGITHCKPGEVSDRATRDLVARCRAEGVAVAAVWAPESPAFRAFYTPSGRAGVEAYGRALAAELGVAVFPAPEHLEEGDFADGYHLLPGGAAKYSRWLADTHLKPWLAAEVLK